MKIKFNTLRKRPSETINYEFLEDMDELGWLSDWSDIDRSNGTVKITMGASYNEKGVYISGTIEAWPIVECSRCLVKFKNSIKVNFNEVLTIKFMADRLINVSFMEEDGGINPVVLDGDRIDLEDYFRQVFLLSQEIKPLCNEKCQGICSCCGADLNAGKCSCNKEDKIDPRWSALKGIRKSE